MKKPADALLSRYASTRDHRDRLKASRDACLCDRHEGVEWKDGVPEQRTGEPCWKAARKWDHEVDWSGEPTGRSSFRFEPPITEWCDTCRARQTYTEQLRVAVREHAAAKRAILQRGRSLARKSAAQETPIPSGQE